MLPDASEGLAGWEGGSVATNAFDGFKNIFTGGNDSEKIIKSGTLFVTRGVGVIAVGLIGLFFALDQAGEGPWKDLSTEQKLDFIVAVGFIWAIVAAADAIARGISTGAKSIKQALTVAREQLLVLDPPLDGRYKSSDGNTVSVKVQAIRLAPGDSTSISEYLILFEGGPIRWKDEGVTLGKAS